MIILEDCVFCKHKTSTDKSILGHFKSYCKAFPEGTDGIPDKILDKGARNIEKCTDDYKFEPKEKWKHLFFK